MTNIYEQHDKAFARVAAFAILKDGQLVGKIAVKYPADGAGRLTVFVHEHGFEMVKGFAGGYGYDKLEAAISDAVRKAALQPDLAESRLYLALAVGINGDGEWRNRLQDNGYKVVHVV